MADTFGAAVEAVVESMNAGLEIERSDLAAALDGLGVYLGKHFRISPSDRSEVASEAMTRFLERCRKGDVRADQAAGLLTVLARNIAVDWLRRTTRETPTDDVTGEVDRRAARDDEIAALLDRRAGRSAVEEAMSSLLDLDDLVPVKVVRAWLDLADELGSVPGTREVAAQVGLSHTTVSRALRRFREFVPDDPAETKKK